MRGYLSDAEVLPGNLCACHGEPVYIYKAAKYASGVRRACAVHVREQHRAYYDRMSGVAYNRKLLKQRRARALLRQRRRTGEGAS